MLGTARLYGRVYEDLHTSEFCICHWGAV